MPPFARKKSIEQLEEENERLGVETQIYEKRSQIAERKAVIKQLERQYGSDWRKILGLGGNADTSTLRSFLGGMKSGIKKGSAGADQYRKSMWPDLVK